MWEDVEGGRRRDGLHLHTEALPPLHNTAQHSTAQHSTAQRDDGGCVEERGLRGERLLSAECWRLPRLSSPPSSSACTAHSTSATPYNLQRSRQQQHTPPPLCCCHSQLPCAAVNSLIQRHSVVTSVRHSQPRSSLPDGSLPHLPGGQRRCRWPSPSPSSPRSPYSHPPYPSHPDDAGHSEVQRPLVPPRPSGQHTTLSCPSPPLHSALPILSQLFPWLPSPSCPPTLPRCVRPVPSRLPLLLPHPRHSVLRAHLRRPPLRPRPAHGPPPQPPRPPSHSSLSRQRRAAAHR